MKKFISAVLAMILTFGVLSVGFTAYAATTASGTCGDNLKWVLDSTGTLTISGTGKMTDWGKTYRDTTTYTYKSTIAPWRDYTVKSVVINDGVESIGAYAFEFCKSLTSVTIPDSVTSIGDCAFEFCESLTSVTISNGVTSIGYETFYGCTSLTGVTIPDSVTSIGRLAFCSCKSLASITIPDGVKIIEVQTFAGCTNLSEITIPASVTIVNENAFHNCASLKDVYYTGSSAEKDKMSIDEEGNSPLLKADWHLNSIPVDDSGNFFTNIINAVKAFFKSIINFFKNLF